MTIDPVPTLMNRPATVHRRPPGTPGALPRRFIVLLAVVFWSAAAGAQQRITLDDAIRLAVASNHDLAAAKLEVARADARVSEAWGTALPRIDLAGRYTRALKKPVFFLPDFENPSSGVVTPIEIGSDHAFDLGVNASQILFNATVFIGVGAAKTYSRGAREQYRAKEAETVTSARTAFYGVLVAREVRDLVQQTLTNAESNFRNASVLYEQGLVSEFDKLRAEVAVENIRPELYDAENRERLALNALRAVIGVPYDQPLDVEGSLEYRQVDTSLLANAQAMMLDANPTLASIKYQSMVSDAIVSAEESNYLPTLSAFGTYSAVAQSNDLNLAKLGFIPSSTIGLSLSLNIFNGLQTAARVEQAGLEYRKSQEVLAGTELRLQSGTEAILLRMRTAEQRILSGGRTVEQAEKGYRIANTRYTNGSGTLLETQDALLALARAKVNRVQAVYEYLAAAAELDGILGRIPPSVATTLE
jgi:outer membrane protein TolC